MRTQRFFAALLVALALTALGSIAPKSAAAAANVPVTIFFTATVDQVRDFHYVLNVKPGDTITGTYTYNAAAVNMSQTPGAGSYLNKTAPYGIHLDVGNTVIETDPQNVHVGMYITNNLYGADSYMVSSKNNRPIPGLWDITALSWGVYDPTMTALKNVNLTKNPPTLSNWLQDADSGLEVQGVDLVPNSEYTLLLRAHVTSVRKI
jgi:hypothetical protein